MSSLRVLFCLILAVKRFDPMGADNSINSPITYNYDIPDIINMDIILQNVPTEVNSYIIYYQTDNCDAYSTDKPCNVPGKNRVIPTNGTIHVLQTLNKRSVRIYIELLRKQNKKCTNTKIIFDGVMDPEARHVTNKVRTACSSNRSPCQVIVDFENKCYEQTSAKIYCKQLNRHSQCESVQKEVLPNNTVHQWFQAYNKGAFIGTIPTARGTKTYFMMSYQKFDRNTYIFSKMSSEHWDEDLPIEKFKISSAIDYNKYNVTKTIRYSDSKLVDFTCSNTASHAQVGMIYSAGDKIVTYNTTRIVLPLNEMHNSSILCCLNYIIHGNDTVKCIHRVVDDFTVLIYDKSITTTSVYTSTGKIYSTNIECESMNGVLTCKSPQEQFPGHNQWYQSYRDGSFIGTIPEAKGIRSQFKMKIQKFDLNTNIFMDSTSQKADFKPSEFNNASAIYNEYNDTNTKLYTESKRINFGCQNNAQIGIIDPTGHRITTYNQTSAVWNFLKRENRSMLCCLYYKTYGSDTMKIIERFVENFTTLIYYESTHLDNFTTRIPETTTKLDDSTHSETTEKSEKMTSAATPESPQSTDASPRTDYTKYYIGAASVVGIAILILLMYISIKKLCRKSNTEQVLELETYATRDMVLYADLNIRPESTRGPVRTEEATYAEIIGVLRPVNANVKK